MFSVYLQLRVFTITQIPGLTSLSLTSMEKMSKIVKILAVNILQFFSGVSKGYKYLESPSPDRHFIVAGFC